MKVLVDNGHGINTKGKCSPDKRLKEYLWTRTASKMIVSRLCEIGIDADLLVPEMNDIPLSTRVKRVNDTCKKLGSSNVLLVSIHNNAGGSGIKWMDSRGFSVFVSKNASKKSKELAEMLTDEAVSRRLIGNRSIPKDKYWTWSWTDKDIYILKNSNCPAVLTENLFQDNKEDVDYLLSPEGLLNLVNLHVEMIKKYCEKYGKTV